MIFLSMNRSDMEIANIIEFIRNELVRMKHTSRGLLKSFSEDNYVGNNILSKFQTYEKTSDPSFRTTYKILRGLLGKPPIKLYDQVDYFAVPLVEGRIAANPAGLIPGDAIESQVWLHRSQIGGRHDLVAVRLAIDADSMEPSLHPGDLVIIDRGDREITPRGLYAVRLPDLESCAVKRLQPVPDKPYVLLLSDNTKYDPLPVDWHEHLIIGRVICSWTNWVT